MIEIYKVETPEQMDAVREIRRVVFIVGQNCPPELEWEFEEESIHFLATYQKVSVACARWRKTEKGIKLERFAVLETYRRKGIASSLVQKLLNEVMGFDKEIYLHAQLEATPLYKKHGFVTRGETFWEAGIEHIKMVYNK